MPIDLARLLSLTERGTRRYTVKDTLLCALGVGCGRDPSDPTDHAFVYEGAGFRALPTMAAVLVEIGRAHV